VKTLPLLFSLVWAVGCGQDDNAPDQDLQPTDVQVEPEPEPEPEPVLDPMDEAMGKVERGELAEGMAAVEALLADNADNAELWFALELCALGSGSPGELLDRLSPTEAIGSQTLAHHSLRATLALAAGRPADAVDAANALKGGSPAVAAAFLARAVQAGAEVPADTLDVTAPGDALVLLMSETNAKKRLELLTTAAGVEGWRAALIRAELLLATEEQHDAGIAELTAVAASDDPRAIIIAATRRLALIEDPAEAAPVAVEAAQKALAAHDTTTATAFLTQAVDLLMRQGKADEALEVARTHLAALPEEPSPVRGQALAATVGAALITGEAREVIELTSAALGVEDPGPAGPALAANLASAGWRVCDSVALDTAAQALPGAQADIALGLAGSCAGDFALAREKLTDVTVTGPLAVDAQLALAWAWLGDPMSVAAANKAVDAATELGWTAARIEAGLALERHARITRDIETASQAIIALEEGASPALLAELYARRLALGVEAAPPAAFDGEPEQVTAWRGFASAPAPADAPTAGVAAWVEAHHALLAGSPSLAKQAYDRAMSTVPVRRQGRWSAPLALDGGDGALLDADIDASIALTNRGGEDALLALHEFSHYRDFHRLASSVGYDWTEGMDPEASAAFADAHTREQARSMLWLAGTGPFPTEARAATLGAIPDQACFATMSAPLDVAGVRTQFAETALFSIRLGVTTGELLLVTPSTTHVERFDKPAQIRGWIEDYLAALSQGRAFGGGATDPRAGDRFRSEVIDGVVGDLVGIARYLVVADPDLMRLPWAVLPEQIEGRRYLADIRTVSSLPFLGEGRTEQTEPETGFKPDFLGISREEMSKLEEMTQEELAVTDDVTRTMLEAGLKPQGETSSIGRLFGGGYSLVKQGAEATLDAFEGKPPAAKENGKKENGFRTARYIHLAGIPASPSGGFQWADGETSLPQLACASTSARLVVISSGPSPEVQLVRAQAFREAGAQGVLVAMWNPPPILRSRYLTSVYDALNRERAPARALAEARETLVNTLGADGGQADPSYWGAFLYVGAP
jgi:hypothetical protein